MATGTEEKHLEQHIENYLCKITGEYQSISPDLYNKENCFIPSELLAFIKATQPEQYKKLQEQHGTQTDQQIIDTLAKNLSKNKTLHTLRNPLRLSGQRIKLLYFKPVSNKTEEHATWYQQNRMSMVRQLQYSTKNKNAIDTVIFINGIPLLTIELKNALTGQYHHNAIKQYMQDRDPKGEKFLEFQRCLVHFAVGTEKVFMTTQLKGSSTFFLPFNQGLKNKGKGFATSYLWEDILSKDSLIDLIQYYINPQTNVDKIYDPKTKGFRDEKKKILLFPRYHQLRAVRRIIDDVIEYGVGNKYLIQHSAGSGKSNTITWLAYKLANFYRKQSDEKALFDSILIVTDRKVLDRQIQNNIRQFDDTPGVVAYIDDKKTSKDLQQAIVQEKRIIITTLQKFPIISKEIAHFPDKNYAVIIDEAHSSQTGNAAGHMRKALSLEVAAQVDERQKDLSDIIEDEIKAQGVQKNISFFAFTATPKPKTEEIFGTKIKGKEAFDYYTMEQAIKEGFILNVINNYMSFKRYYKLVKRKEIDDKEYDKKKAINLLNSFVDLQDHAIEKKSRIMIEHFVAQTQNKIEGKARAMLVTRSRLHAVRYKRKFDDIMREMRLPYSALVAFSGTVKDEETGEEYTEKSMNNLKGKVQIPEALKMPDFRILIVANKYQTGFDEPLLHTMFVDKKLGGANTVQTLSRLNRTCNGKDSTMVLDFVNDPEQVHEDFQHFYGKNHIPEDKLTDPNSIYDLLHNIEAYDLLYMTEIDAFAEIFFRNGDNFEDLHPILDEVANRFVDQLSEDQQADFKRDAKAFIKFYQFLRAIVTFTDEELEKYYVFLSALLKKLPYVKTKLPVDLLGEIELHSYKVQHEYTHNLKLESKDGEDKGLTPDGGGGGKPIEDLDFLSHIIKALNDTFGIDLTDDDRIDFDQMKENIYSNDELMSFFNQNNTKDNIQEKFFEEIDSELLNFINNKLEFYNKMTEDRVNTMFKNLWFNQLYDSKVRGLNR